MYVAQAFAEARLRAAETLAKQQAAGGTPCMITRLYRPTFAFH